MLMIKFTEKEYQAKIDKLESYYTQLSTHLERMEELKEEMFAFWNDEAGRQAGLVLHQEIQSVQTAMDYTQSMIQNYKNAISEFGKVGLVTGGLLEKALHVVSSLDDI